MSPGIASSFGIRLAGFRQAAGLSRRALARGAGVSDSTVRGLEAGEQDPHLDVAERLAEGLGVSLVTLLGEPVAAQRSSYRIATRCQECADRSIAEVEHGKTPDDVRVRRCIRCGAFALKPDLTIRTTA
jgi:transcriptional regulator with XRE-family HTH domain